MSLRQARRIAEPYKNGSMHTDGRHYRIVTGFLGFLLPTFFDCCKTYKG